MTTELTLREKVIEAVFERLGNIELGEDYGTSDLISIIADLLDATGAPDYCRVAADLRGEWVERVDGAE